MREIYLHFIAWNTKVNFKKKKKESFLSLSLILIRWNYRSGVREKTAHPVSPGVDWLFDIRF